MRTGESPASKAVIQSMPLFPATAASHVARASLPSGVTAPRPVTATRLIAERLRAAADPERDLGAAGLAYARARPLSDDDSAPRARAHAPHLAERAVRPRQGRLRLREGAAVEPW